MPRKQSRSRLRALTLHLVLTGLLLVSALFPVGMMAQAGADGQTVMVICSGDGPMRLVLDPVTGQFHKAPSSGKTGCDWAMAQDAGDIAAPPALPLPPLAHSRAAPVQASLLWRPAHDPRGIWARGPPSLV